MTTALLLVDIQNDFCSNGALAVPDGDAVVEVGNRLLPYFSHVVASLDCHPHDHISFSEWPPHCVEGSPGAELHPELNSEAITLHVKKGRATEFENFSAFSDDPHQISCNLQQYLNRHHITNLCVIGLATEYCVLQTVLSALQLGFHVTVIEDGIRGIGDGAEQEKIKLQMKENGAQFMHAEEWIAAHQKMVSLRACLKSLNKLDVF